MADNIDKKETNMSPDIKIDTGLIDTGIRPPKKGPVSYLPKPIQTLIRVAGMASMINVGAIANPQGKDVSPNQFPQPIAAVDPNIPTTDTPFSLKTDLSDSLIKMSPRIPVGGVPTELVKPAEQSVPVNIPTYSFGQDIKSQYFPEGSGDFPTFIQKVITESQNNQPLTPDEQNIVSAILKDPGYQAIINGFDGAIKQLASIQGTTPDQYGKLFAYSQSSSALVAGGIIIRYDPQNPNTIKSFFVPEGDSQREIPVPSGSLVDLTFLTLSDGSSELVVILKDATNPSDFSKVRVLFVDGQNYSVVPVTSQNNGVMPTPSFNNNEQLAKFTENNTSTDTTPIDTSGNYIGEVWTDLKTNKYAINWNTPIKYTTNNEGLTGTITIDGKTYKIQANGVKDFVGKQEVDDTVNNVQLIMINKNATFAGVLGTRTVNTTPGFGAPAQIQIVDIEIISDDNKGRLLKQIFSIQLPKSRVGGGTGPQIGDVNNFLSNLKPGDKIDPTFVLAKTSWADIAQKEMQNVQNHPSIEATDRNDVSLWSITDIYRNALLSLGTSNEASGYLGVAFGVARLGH